MNEIEKLYENTGVKKKIMCDWTCNCGGKFSDNCSVHCLHYEDKDLYYPPFTADKVLKIIVFFLNKGIRLDFSVKENTRISVENFKKCIAQIGAKYWQDLTEKEKRQIKEILE